MSMKELEAEMESLKATVGELGNTVNEMSEAIGEKGESQTSQAEDINKILELLTGLQEDVSRNAQAIANLIERNESAENDPAENGNTGEGNDTDDRVSKAVNTAVDETTRLARSFANAGLESMAQMAKFAEKVADKTDKENKKRKKDRNKAFYFPADLMEGFLEASGDLDDNVSKVIDKFNETYKKEDD